MRFAITEYVPDNGEEIVERTIPFNATQTQVLAAFNVFFLDLVEAVEKDGKQRFISVSIAPNDDPIMRHNPTAKVL